MKKQLLSILALILCFCTVFVFASCGKKNDDDASSDSLGESNNESFDVEEGLEDVDADTAETIFAQMKADYNATIGYKDAYSLTIDWVEDQTDTESGDDSSNKTTKNKTVDKQTVTADPASGKAAAVLNEDRYENDKKISTSVMESKYFNQNSKNYVYYSSKADDIVEYEDYNSLTDYGFANAKKDIILSENFNVHFAESFGNPFAASSARFIVTISVACSLPPAIQPTSKEATGLRASLITNVVIPLSLPENVSVIFTLNLSIISASRST